MHLPFSKRIIKRDDGKPYLIRYRIFSSRWLKIRLHHILLSDYDCVHDHPWDFISIILKGGYWEHTPMREIIQHHAPQLPWVMAQKGNWRENKESIWKRWYAPGSVLRRNAEYRHKIELETMRSIGSVESKPLECWSLVFMFKRKRDWGFWMRNVFIPWRKYSSIQKCD